MSPKLLLLAHVYFTDQKYKKPVLSNSLTIYSPDNSYFTVTMKLLMAQLLKNDFLKTSSVKVQDIMLQSGYTS